MSTMVCTSLAWASTLAAASRFMSAGAVAKAGVSLEAQSKRLAVRRRTEATIKLSPKKCGRLRIERSRPAAHQPPPPELVSPEDLGGVIFRMGPVGGLGNLMPNWSR